MTAEGRDPGGTQERIRELRARLLSGRGPGASPDEIALSTRDRPTLAGRPSAEALEWLVAQTRLARGGPREIGQVIREQRADLIASIGALGDRLWPTSVLRAIARRGALVLLIALATAVVCRSFEPRALGQHRSGQEPCGEGDVQ